MGVVLEPWSRDSVKSIENAEVDEVSDSSKDWRVRWHPVEVQLWLHVGMYVHSEVDVGFVE